MPKWPYVPTVSNDLRELFGEVRKVRTTRHLGQSSITRGEGSLDLYENDTGPVRARYGDLPDGSFGVGLTHRGAFWNVSDLIGQGQDHDDIQDGRLDNHARRVGWAEDRLDDAEGRLDGHATRLGNAEGRLDNHAGRIGSAEGRLDSHAGRIGATETKNTQQDGRLDNHAGRIGAVESLASNASGRLDSHMSRISSAEGRLDSHVSRIGAVENQVSTLISRQAEIIAWIIRARQNDPGLPPWPGL